MTSLKTFGSQASDSGGSEWFSSTWPQNKTPDYITTWTYTTSSVTKKFSVWWTPFSGQNSVEISYGVPGVVDWLKSGSGRGQWEKTRLIHKRPEGEVAAARAP